MSKKYYTADWHLGMSDILRFEQRPFSSVEDMDDYLIQACNNTAKAYYKTDVVGNKIVTDRDMVVHVGDLCSYKNDRGNAGLSCKPQEIVSQINATFVNLRGNHDLNNKVKSIGSSMMTNVGKIYSHVFICHFPSYDKRCDPIPKGVFMQLCGHVHRKWKHCLDTTNGILNINVGVDAWNFKLVSEEDILAYAESLMKLPPSKLNRVKIVSSGKVVKV